MGDLIKEHQVKAFSSNVFHECQQMKSRLRSAVRNEMFVGEEKFFDSYGSVEAREKLGRNEEVIYDSVPHNRRKVSTAPYYFAELVDMCDELRMIHDPKSQYVKSAVMGLNRRIDDIVIASALGPAFFGKGGTVRQDLSNSQKVVAHDGTNVTGSPLNVKTLRLIKRKFDENEVDEKIYMTVTAADIQALLAETEISSADFNTVRALVNGEINTFMGIEFIRLERTPLLGADIAIDSNKGLVGSGTDSTDISTDSYKRNFAFTKSGIILGMQKDITARVTQLPEKHYDWQIYTSMKFGGVRTEECKVVEVLTKQC